MSKSNREYVIELDRCLATLKQTPTNKFELQRWSEELLKTDKVVVRNIVSAISLAIGLDMLLTDMAAFKLISSAAMKVLRDKTRKLLGDPETMRCKQLAAVLAEIQSAF